MTAATGRHSEVANHFDRYAEGDRWGALYDPGNPASHSFLARRAATVALLGDLTDARVLDIGCGSGALLGPLARADLAAYVGIDVAPTMIQEARRNAGELGLGERFAFDTGDVTALDLPGAGFDCVVGMGLLEYFDDPSVVVREALRVTKPGGLVVFTIPNRACLNNWMIRLFAPFRALGRGLTGRRRDDVRREEYGPAEFRRLFTGLGCEVVGESFYNKLVLPYPLTALAPGLARAAARRAEATAGLHWTATGLIVSARRE
jgi:SAM-dependent methyltransferase